MSLEGNLHTLRRDLHKLQEAVWALHVTVVEDKPGEVALADWFENVATDLLGRLEGALSLVAEAQAACAENAPPDKPRAPLYNAHALINEFAGTFLMDLAAHDRLASLLRMGVERGRRWHDWSQMVKTAVDRCEAPMGEVAAALLSAWLALVERVGKQSISVQATNIGQQITLRDTHRETVANEV